MIMSLTITEARSIAAGWISPSPHDANLTAFATGHPRWTAEGLADEVQRNIDDVRAHPKSYDDVGACLCELKQLRDWATDQQDDDQPDQETGLHADW
jgi:hypothetical protein